MMELSYISPTEIAMVMALFYLPIVFAFIFGTIIGSLSNVIIHRLVYYRSIWSPGSHCYACGTEIPGWLNIPLVSYIRLRGKCSTCGTGFSSRYFWVELITGLIYAAVVMQVYTMEPPVELDLTFREMLTFNFDNGFPPTFYPDPWGLAMIFKGFLFGSMLLILAMIDLEHHLLPWRITIPGMYIGLAIALIAPPSGPVLFSLGDAWWAGPVNALALAFFGLLVGGGILWVIHWVYPAGMGGGDVVLLAMIGAFVGFRAIGPSMFLGFVVGGVIAILLMVLGKKKRKDMIPFGPFLSLGGILGWFGGYEIWEWYAINFIT